jgi:transposase
MGNKTGHLSEGEKIRILTLYDSGHLSVAQIARRIKRSPKAVARWIDRFHTCHTILEKKHTGRKPALSKKACKAAYQLLAKNGRMSATRVAVRLHLHHLCNEYVSATTVIAAARKYAKEKALPKLVANWSNPKRKLSKANKELRLQFCKQNISRDWGSVMFTDRCKFSLKYPGVHFQRKIWRQAGQSYQEYFPTKPSAMYNVYGGVTVHGPTRLIPVTGTTGLKLYKEYKTKRQQKARGITQSEYTAVARSLLAQGHKLFKGQPWGLIQDNDKAHKGMQPALKSWNRQHPSNVSLIKFPPNSPDINLIENVWGYILPKVEAVGCKTTKQFQGRVDREFSNLSKPYLKQLFSSMTKRIKECISKGGDRTAY